MQEPVAKPWYKEPWPFILIGITGLGVVAGSTLAFIGISNPPEIVRGDYAQFARGLVDTNVRTGRARELGLSGSMALADAQLTLNLSAIDPQALPAQLLVQFQHPAYSELDATVLLQRQADGRFVGQIGEAPHERAQVIVTDLEQTWWLSGRLGSMGPGVVDLVPKRL
jgi:uncharacterized protein